MSATVLEYLRHGKYWMETILYRLQKERIRSIESRGYRDLSDSLLVRKEDYSNSSKLYY